jgi:hypothetical protein
MSFVFGRATTAAEIAAVQRLRYAVYVDELGRYRDVADGENQMFTEPEDDNSWLFYARDGDEVVAATRITWGGDGFSRRQIDQYQLAPFLEDLPAGLMAVGERSSVLPAYRGTGVLDGMLLQTSALILEHELRLVFGCCEPHLLSLYLGMGQRPYAERNINSPSAGYLIPLVSFLPDAEALRGIGHSTRPDQLPASVERVLAHSGAVRSQAQSAGDDYWGEIRRTLDELHAQRISAFDSFTDDEAQRCIARSTIVECAAGDRILKRGGSARNIFVVLEGTFEVRDGERIVGVLSAGDAFGEMAFLLQRPRSFDVDAATDAARILSLSEGALRKMIAEDATVAAKLLLNLSKMLCIRLIKTN